MIIRYRFRDRSCVCVARSWRQLRSICREHAVKIWRREHDDEHGVILEDRTIMNADMALLPQDD